MTPKENDSLWMDVSETYAYQSRTTIRLRTRHDHNNVPYRELTLNPNKPTQQTITFFPTQNSWFSLVYLGRGVGFLFGDPKDTERVAKNLLATIFPFTRRNRSPWSMATFASNGGW